VSKVDLIIKNGKVYTSAGFQNLDVAVTEDKIASITMPGRIQNADRTIDADGKYVLPGIIDFHTHIREPGFTHKEDFETGTRAAAAGGVTMVCPQPPVNPVPNTVENYRNEIELGKRKALVDFNPSANPLLYEEGWVPKLAAEGAVCFKVFQYAMADGTINTAHLFEAFKEIAKTGMYCSIHPSDHFFLNEAPQKMRKLGLPMTLENYAFLVFTHEEVAGAAYEIYFLAKKAKMKWYALHCFFPSYIDLVRWAKTEKEIDVVASCEVMSGIYSPAQVYDVKRREWFEVGKHDTISDIEKTWAAINDGTIDFLTTDHAPHLREEYKVPPHYVSGFPILEWYGHILLNEVNKGNISLERLVEVTSTNGAKIFGFYPRKGAILPGADADLIICDLDREWTITSQRVYTKCQINPYHDQKIKGKVTHTILRGKVIMEEGEVIGEPGYGKFIAPLKR